MNQEIPPSPANAADAAPVLTPEPLSPDEFDEIDTILDELRTRYDETPQWEFCEGFMAALICCRRVIPSSEYLPVLLGIGGEDAEDEGSFADDAQHKRFMDLWTRRWNEVTQALNAEIEGLDDEAAYQPEVMDVRGAIAALPEDERAAIDMDEVPSFGQVWALGFMFAVESWPDEWAAPRDKEAVKWLNAALEAIVALTEDDTEPATMSVFEDDGPPSVSLKRLNAFADAVWAVYDLHELWRNFGPRVETVRKEATPGRNDPCFCGSGKKYKKCHGAS
ncbi:MAG: UPF0149 family protein [Rhodoferax sp.]|uniref:UPF0149 family protein n=1 Tax=Rhodoferax sp. TaxID=50421 RepID=UPI00271B0AFD|nr:UPF0149 family protein [Rhodoferax sp.]MDO8449359.1 UPF0149 family protein [Rhodoferax sp.]